jgi:DNA (cytosine-5)-methyltransferase 1
MAVEHVFGGTVVWHSEIDKAASKVLAHRYPDVPNLGDITEINWDNWKPMLEVDILCGGFPCQDVSAAGKRAGIKDGTRSGLWSVFAEAIDILRPSIVIIENVRGLLSATAHRMESDATALGDRGTRPVLRAAGAVLGDLADLGYDAQWTTVAAADVGAPHRRERVFILATATDTPTNGLPGQGLSRGVDPAQPESGRSAVSLRQHSPDSSRIGGDEGRPELARIVGGSDAAVSGDTDGRGRTAAPYAGNDGRPGETDNARGRRSSDCFGAGLHGDGGMDLRTTVTLLPTPTAVQGRNETSGRQEGSQHHSGTTLNDVAFKGEWGKYEPAIRRWEQLTRPAPAPTEPNKNGNPRLAAAFSEWLMGWPDGWVTDPAIGISRNDQLKIVGNGVCPQQAAAALRYLLEVSQ